MLDPFQNVLNPLIVTSRLIDMENYVNIVNKKKILNLQQSCNGE